MLRSDTRRLIPASGKNGFIPPSFLLSITPSISSPTGRHRGLRQALGIMRSQRSSPDLKDLQESEEEEREIQPAPPQVYGDPGKSGVQRALSSGFSFIRIMVTVLFVGPHLPQPSAGHPVYGISVPFSAL